MFRLGQRINQCERYESNYLVAFFLVDYIMNESKMGSSKHHQKSGISTIEPLHKEIGMNKLVASNYKSWL